ncbi:hypothetical protein DPV78_009239 [Talaromyces pinophilus]|nr:hypothetical protein DPV78_009239 [Talaromyces pinophilus]
MRGRALFLIPQSTSSAVSLQSHCRYQGKLYYELQMKFEKRHGEDQRAIAYVNSKREPEPAIAYVNSKRDPEPEPAIAYVNSK